MRFYANNNDDDGQQTNFDQKSSLERSAKIFKVMTNVVLAIQSQAYAHAFMLVGQNHIKWNTQMQLYLSL